MKTKYIFLSGVISLAITSVFTSCEKELKFGGEETQNLLVVNGFLNPDEKATVHLSRSRFFLDNTDFTEIKDGDVELWKGGELLEILKNTEELPGHYTGSYYPKEGDILQVKARVKGLDPTESTVVIPSSVPIIGVDTVAINYNGWVSSYYYDFETGGYIKCDSGAYSLAYNLHIRFRDIPGVADYYRLVPSIEATYDNGETIYWSAWFESDDPAFGGKNIINGDEEENYYNEFSDELFDGKEYRLKIRMENYAYNYYNGTTLRSIAIVMELQHISEAYYLYLRSRTYAANSDEYGGLFSEPVQIYSNIGGGVGILGTFSKSIFRIPLTIDFD